MIYFFAKLLRLFGINRKGWNGQVIIVLLIKIIKIGTKKVTCSIALALTLIGGTSFVNIPVNAAENATINSKSQKTPRDLGNLVIAYKHIEKDQQKRSNFNTSCLRSTPGNINERNEFASNTVTIM